MYCDVGSGNSFQWPPARYQEDRPLYISPHSRTSSPAPATPPIRAKSPVRSPVPILKNTIQTSFQSNNQETSQHVQFKNEQTLNDVKERYLTSQQGTPIPLTVNRSAELG